MAVSRRPTQKLAKTRRRPGGAFSSVLCRIESRPANLRPSLKLLAVSQATPDEGGVGGFSPDRGAQELGAEPRLGAYGAATWNL